MTQQIFDPASESEAEMAGAARACIVAALDHSKADSIKVTIQVDDASGDAPVLHYHRVHYAFLQISCDRWPSASLWC
jgi:hypothetical protein